MRTFADKASKYFLGLKSPASLPENIATINPYKTPEVQSVVKQFFNKFFNDSNTRLYVFGINPGRFGGGLTGIAFTDPVALRENCGIQNDLGTRKELSSKFIYNLVNEFSGTQKFFSRIYLTALYPLAIVKDGKNYNYYDKPALYRALKKHIEQSIKEQAEFGARRDIAISLGKKNAKYLQEINDQYGFFNKIKVLDHPRYIMQYKLKQMNKYLKDYLSAMSN